MFRSVVRLVSCTGKGSKPKDGFKQELQDRRENAETRNSNSSPVREHTWGNCNRWRDR